MKEQDIQIPSKKIAITQLTRKLADDFMQYSYFNSARQRGDVLNHGLRYRLLKTVKLIPHATRLVAYQTEEKKAIGFLYLEENTEWLYTIEYLFVDPRYRKIGLATSLLKYAMTLAKEKGAKKVNLSVDSNSTRAIELYRKMGFERIGSILLVQAYLSQSPLLKLIKRAIVGQGCFTKLALGKKDQLYELETNVKKNREALFGIYQRCMDQSWVDFFEINSSNLINGSRHLWQPPFFKDAFINDVGNSFALIFHPPFSLKSTVELYGASSNSILPMLDDLLKILINRGVSLMQISLFNPSINEYYSWLEEKGMQTFQFLCMGKAL